MSNAGAHSGRGLSREQISERDEHRYWRLVEKTSRCWYWRLADRGEYGALRLRDAAIHTKAHKIAVVLSGREVPEGAVILHSCDEPSCVNPRHLSIGTQRDNVRDCIRKGRHRKQAA